MEETVFVLLFQFYKQTHYLKCGKVYEAVVYYFHHRDVDKENMVSRAIVNYSIERLADEVSKCDMICANCRRILHKEERYDG